MPSKPKADKQPGAEFAARVHAFVRKVPQGRVTTYGDVAWSIGHPGAARAVGKVMRDTPDDSPTPCHRVVRAGGHVVPVRGNSLVAKLKAEGVPVKRGSVVAFAKRRWP